MFVYEDPSNKWSIRSRELRNSSVRSYIGKIGRRESNKCVVKPIVPIFKSVRRSKDRSFVQHFRQYNGKEGNSPDEHASTSSDMPTGLVQDRSSCYSSSLGWRSVTSPASCLVAIAPDDSFREARSIQFFIERTMHEWAGYYDDHFWQTLALQASVSQPSARHGLVCLASMHEAFEIPDSNRSRSAKAYAYSQGMHAITKLTQDHSNMSLSSLLSTHIIIAASLCFLDRSSHLQAIRVVYGLEEQLQIGCVKEKHTISDFDRHYILAYLVPLLQRHRGRDAQLADMLYSLQASKASNHTVNSEPSIPTAFATLDAARSCVEHLLNWMTFKVKTTSGCMRDIFAKGDAYMDRWLRGLNQIHGQGERLSERHICNVAILRVCAKVYFMMIKMMDCNDETAFDDYLEVYEELAFVFRQMLAYNKKHARTNFKITSCSFLNFVGGATLRWCRDPSVRRDLIGLLEMADVREGIESSTVWSNISRCVMRVEEEDVFPPPATAADIPASSRVRFTSCEFYAAHAMQKVQYLRAPYQDGADSKNIYLQNREDGSILQHSLNSFDLSINPNTVIGRGFVKWLKAGSTDDYFVVKSSKFYFGFPRI